MTKDQDYERIKKQLEALPPEVRQQLLRETTAPDSNSLPSDLPATPEVEASAGESSTAEADPYSNLQFQLEQSVKRPGLMQYLGCGLLVAASIGGVIGLAILIKKVAVMLGWW